MRARWLVLVLWAGCAGPDGRAQQPAPEAPAHPGTIVFVDEGAGTEETKPVDAVPEGIAWVEVDGQRVPVVRVVRRQAGERIVLVSYGPDGEALERTVGRAAAPEPPAAATADLLVGSGLAVQGALAASTVRTALGEVEEALEDCFARSAPARAAGRVEARAELSVDGSGRVGITGLETGVDDPALEACLEGTLDDLALPGAGEGTEVAVPLFVRVE